jgi:hypothetical protein
MNSKVSDAVLIAVVVAAGLFGWRQWSAVQRARAANRALALTSGWFPAARLAAREMISRYGPPQEVSSFELRWHGPSPWKRIVVQNEPEAPLEDVVTYYVPPDKLPALTRFPHGLRVYAAEGALSARSDRESLNLLALNLANDIATGNLTPEEANSFFVRTRLLQESGKSSSYMERLLFEPGLKPDYAYPPP